MSPFDDGYRKLAENRDILGREIKPGDYIVYGAAKGRCAGLNIGRVLARDGTSVKARAVIEYFGRYKKALRDVTLQYTERMCVVPAESVPSHLIEALGP